METRHRSNRPELCDAEPAESAEQRGSARPRQRNRDGEPATCRRQCRHVRHYRAASLSACAAADLDSASARPAAHGREPAYARHSFPAPGRGRNENRIRNIPIRGGRPAAFEHRHPGQHLINIRRHRRIVLSDMVHKVTHETWDTRQELVVWFPDKTIILQFFQHALCIDVLAGNEHSRLGRGGDGLLSLLTAERPRVLFHGGRHGVVRGQIRILILTFVDLVDPPLVKPQPFLIHLRLCLSHVAHRQRHSPALRHPPQFPPPHLEKQHRRDQHRQRRPTPAARSARSEKQQRRDENQRDQTGRPAKPGRRRVRRCMTGNGI